MPWEVKRLEQEAKAAEEAAAEAEKVRLFELAQKKAREDGSIKVQCSIQMALPSKSRGIFPLGRNALVRFVCVPAPHTRTHNPHILLTTSHLNALSLYLNALE